MRLTKPLTMPVTVLDRRFQRDPGRRRQHLVHHIAATHLLHHRVTRRSRPVPQKPRDTRDLKTVQNTTQINQLDVGVTEVPSPSAPSTHRRRVTAPSIPSPGSDVPKQASWHPQPRRPPYSKTLPHAPRPQRPPCTARHSSRNVCLHHHPTGRRNPAPYPLPRRPTAMRLRPLHRRPGRTAQHPLTVSNAGCTSSQVTERRPKAPRANPSKASRGHRQQPPPSRSAHKSDQCPARSPLSAHLQPSRDSRRPSRGCGGKPLRGRPKWRSG